MSVEQADRNLDHLYPLFADRVKLVMEQVRRETAGKIPGVAGWIVEEGFRSQARQEWLYAQGRTRPGPIVTYKRGASGNHPKGLAVDVWPTNHAGEIIWNVDGRAWQWLAHAARQQGLQSGLDYPSITGGTFVDAPHIEPKLATALLWTPAALLYLKKLGLR